MMDYYNPGWMEVEEARMEALRSRWDEDYETDEPEDDDEEDD